MNFNKKQLSLVAVVGIATSLAMAVPAFAQTSTTPAVGHFRQGEMGEGKGMRVPGVFGIVSAINGNSITVNSKMGPNGVATTYTVDATNATVMKNKTTATVSGIAVGDTIMAQGTISGANVVAKTIRDGIPQRGQGQEKGQGQELGQGSEKGFNPQVAGNGQPVIAGSVTALNGSILTVSNKSNVVYTVDATNATVYKGNATSTVSSVVVGDNVVIQGSVNGTSVIASNVMDRGIPPANPNPATANGTTGQPQQRGFFQRVGGFFSRMFGF